MDFLRKLFGKKQPMGTPKKSVDEWCEEGNSLASRGQYSEALACLEKALQIDPKHALAWFNMGLTLMNLGEKDKAVKAFTTFIKYAPPQAQALHVPTAKGYIQMLSTGAGITRIDL
jgi:tetratricopeptide (TPR) repeat protein